jgi:signal transduction histidine kinase
VKSIRSFLLTRLVGGATLVLAAAGLAVYLVVARSLAAQFDGELTQRVAGFASILFQVADEVEFEFSDQLMPEYVRADAPAYFELWFRDGPVLERSESLRGADLALPEPPTFTPAHWSAPLPDGRPGRYVSQLIEVHHVHPEEGPERPAAAQVLVVVARGTEELAAAELRVLGACALVALALLALLAGSAWIAVDRGLAPARRLAQTLDAIDVQRLPRGLGLGPLPAELRPVADKTDALIRRVDAALERERRTTADIAHELRTPVSELLTVSEVALRNGHDPEGSRKALSTVRNVAARMGRALSTLLKLARLEMGAESCAREAVELPALLAELLRPLAALERERELVVRNRVEPGARVEADREVLRIVLSNLLANALYYSPRRGLVELRLEGGGAQWELAVENEAPELRAEDLPSLADPFWRKDGARTDRDRSGLGLALSRTLAAETGMQLEFALEGGLFRASLGPRRRGSDGGGGRAPREHSDQRRTVAAAEETLPTP